MWLFRRRKKQDKAGKMVERVIVGLVIGGAIGSIIGKKMLDKHEGNDEEKEKED